MVKGQVFTYKLTLTTTDVTVIDLSAIVGDGVKLVQQLTAEADENNSAAIRIGDTEIDSTQGKSISPGYDYTFCNVYWPGINVVGAVDDVINFIGVL